jgi:hypothetical protein
MVSGQRHAPAALYPRGKDPGTRWTGGWVGPRAGLDIEARGEILSSLPGIEPRSPDRPDRSQTLYCLSYPPHPYNNTRMYADSTEDNGGPLAENPY